MRPGGHTTCLHSLSPCTVIFPGHDDSLRDNASNVQITVPVEPPVQPGYWLEFRLNDMTACFAHGSGLNLTKADRSKHKVRTHIVDARRKSLQQRKSTRFSCIGCRDCISGAETDLHPPGAQPTIRGRTPALLHLFGAPVDYTSTRAPTAAQTGPDIQPNLGTGTELALLW